MTTHAVSSHRTHAVHTIAKPKRTGAAGAPTTDPVQGPVKQSPSTSVDQASSGTKLTKPDKGQVTQATSDAITSVLQNKRGPHGATPPSVKTPKHAPGATGADVRPNTVAATRQAARVQVAPATPKVEQLQQPVDGPITAHIGEMSSIRSGRHTGTDFGVPTGTKVRAAASGKVVSAKYDGAFGNEVIIQHGPKLYTEYAHMSKLEVQVGDTIEQGDEIGLSGATGNATGPHVHFEVRNQIGFDRGNPNDPEKFLGKPLTEDVLGGKAVSGGGSSTTSTTGDTGSTSDAGSSSTPADAGSSDGVSTDGTGGSASDGGSSPVASSPASEISHADRAGHGHSHGSGGSDSGSGSGDGSSSAGGGGENGAPDAGAGAATADVQPAATTTAASLAAATPLTSADLATLPENLRADVVAFGQLSPQEQLTALIYRLDALRTLRAGATTDAQRAELAAQDALTTWYVRMADPNVVVAATQAGMPLPAPATTASVTTGAAGAPAAVTSAADDAAAGAGMANSSMAGMDMSSMAA